MGAHSKTEAGQEPTPHEPTPPQPTPPAKPGYRWRNQVAADRRFTMLWAIIAVVAVAIAALTFTVGAQSRAEPAPEDPTAVRAAADAITSLMTFSPDQTAEQRESVANQLTGILAADYAARGPDVVFPNAVASKVSMKTTVSSAAPGSRHDELMTVLVFATQEVTVGQAQDYPTRIGIARWATVTKIGDVWRLSRLQNVSPQ
ncbi:MAG: hypothetical protein WBA98_16370 [Gordonia sp. (in: high G+C Gram-positive bacteria)]|uniref:hypothetical protein n=1 Tax=Gordonia sp. (in: high G+C Gram-positive bacteria) TaxID=84139 RepID=UPI003C7663CB